MTAAFPANPKMSLVSPGNPPKSQRLVWSAMSVSELRLSSAM